MMDAAMVGILGIIALLIVLFILGMPVGFAMAVVGFCGFSYVVTPQAALNMIATDLWSTFSKYGLTVIPLFILMGYLAFNAGIAERLYDAAYKWVGHWRGGLAIATIAADEMFAAICGSNTATAATMGAVALPQMNKYNYDTRLSTGTVVTGGTLGTVMPPSVVLIIIGLQTEQSIVKLFMAGILPAIVLGLLFVITIIVLCRLYPDFGPAGPKTSLVEKFKSLLGVIEAVTIFALVIGGLYFGVFTPTEAGAAGVLITLIVSIVSRKLTWKGFMRSIGDTLKISCMVYMLVAGAIIFVTDTPYIVHNTANCYTVNRITL
jgi:tripartite ATP-independent transporter DctM subunit